MRLVEQWRKDLLPYQEEGIEFLVAKDTDNGNAGIFDEMGLGKTVEAIRGADALGFLRVFIVCPAIARLNWERELERWQILPRKIFVVKTARAPIPDDADCIIVSYDMLANGDFRKSISAYRFDLAIVDEAHMLKNRAAARTRAFYGERMDGSGLVSLMGRVWLLTGTPMPNHAGELFTHLRALAANRIREEDGRMTYVQFVNKFCIVERKQFGMRVVERVLGNKNVVELRNRINGFYIRRRKDEVLKDLPPLQWGTVVLVPPPLAARAIKEEEKKSKVQLILEAAAAAHHNKDERLAEQILEFLDTNNKGLASLRRLLGVAKVEPTIEFVKTELESTKKIILFAYHKEVIAALAKGLEAFGVVVVTGDTDPKARQQAIDSFQQDEETRVFIGQITATNTAITLTASDYALIVEPSWTPSENVQAAARAHRVGQKSSCVTAKYVILAGSLDEIIIRVLMRKSKQISEIMF
jgi:SNF2 family DNA or RNA helicase